MGKIIKKRIEYGGSSNSAENIKYDDTKNVKEAINEVKSELTNVNSNLVKYNSETDALDVYVDGVLVGSLPCEFQTTVMDLATETTISNWTCNQSLNVSASGIGGYTMVNSTSSAVCDVAIKCSIKSKLNIVGTMESGVGTLYVYYDEFDSNYRTLATITGATFNQNISLSALSGKTIRIRVDRRNDDTSWGYNWAISKLKVYTA